MVVAVLAALLLTMEMEGEPPPPPIGIIIGIIGIIMPLPPPPPLQSAFFRLDLDSWNTETSSLLEVSVGIGKCIVVSKMLKVIKIHKKNLTSQTFIAANNTSQKSTMAKYK